MSGEFLKNINYLEGLYVFGSGENDQLKPINENVDEDKQIFESSIPRKIPLHFVSNNESIKLIKCGIQSTIILSTEGNVYTFGCSDNGALGHEDSFSVERVPLKFPAIGISGGDAHGIAYNRNNLAFWGQFKSSSKWLDKPCINPTYFNNSHINGEIYKKAISGTNHVIILSEKKNVFAFGCNEYGQVGVSRSKILHHFQINKLHEKNVEDIFTGDEHSFLTKYEGNVKILKAWGFNGSGQLGIGSYPTRINENSSIYVPTKVIFPGITKVSVKKVEGGDSTSICLSEDNRVFVWGSNEFSQLGLQIKDKIIPRPRELMFFNPNSEADNTVNEIYAKSQYFYAKNNVNNKVYSWGAGDHYVLGNRKEKDENSPYLVNHLFFKNLYVSDLALGSEHVAVFLTEKKDMNMSQPTSKEINKNDNSVKSQKNKPIKRKTMNFPGERDQKIDDLFIKIKEEFITLKESDQPKTSINKIVTEKKDNYDNINKYTEEEKNKAEKIENINSKSQSNLDLENNSKNIEKTEYGKKRMIYPKKEEEKEKSSSKSSKKKSNSKNKKSEKNGNNGDEEQERKSNKKRSKSKTKKRIIYPKDEDKEEYHDDEGEKEQKNEKDSPVDKKRKSSSKKEKEKEKKEESKKETQKNKIKSNKKITSKEKDKPDEKDSDSEKDHAKGIRKSSRNKKPKKVDVENEEEDNDENLENNSSGKKPKNNKTPSKKENKKSENKRGNKREKTKSKSKSKSREKYAKKK